MHDYLAIAAEIFTGTYILFSAFGNLLTRAKNPKAKAVGQKLVKVALEIQAIEKKLEEELEPSKE